MVPLIDELVCKDHTPINNRPILEKVLEIGQQIFLRYPNDTSMWIHCPESSSGLSALYKVIKTYKNIYIWRILNCISCKEKYAERITKLRKKHKTSEAEIKTKHCMDQNPICYEIIMIVYGTYLQPDTSYITSISMGITHLISSKNHTDTIYSWDRNVSEYIPTFRDSFCNIKYKRSQYPDGWHITKTKLYVNCLLEQLLDVNSAYEWIINVDTINISFENP